MIFPSIPIPTEDPKALLETCLTMKRTLEMLTGQDQGETFAPHVFVQADVPVAHNVGDLWLCTALTQSFNCWTGAAWVRIATVTSMTLDGDLNLQAFAQRRHR